jgi:hypothetical protein
VLYQFKLILSRVGLIQPFDHGRQNPVTPAKAQSVSDDPACDSRRLEPSCRRRQLPKAQSKPVVLHRISTPVWFFGELPNEAAKAATHSAWDHFFAASVFDMSSNPVYELTHEF